MDSWPLIKNYWVDYWSLIHLAVTKSIIPSIIYVEIGYYQKMYLNDPYSIKIDEVINIFYDLINYQFKLWIWILFVNWLLWSDSNWTVFKRPCWNAVFVIQFDLWGLITYAYKKGKKGFSTFNTLTTCNNNFFSSTL